MPGSSTSSGDAISELCVETAGLLNLDIYDNLADDLPPELAPKLAEVKRYWTMEWEIRDRDGFLCRFYVPAAGNSADPDSTCPPVLCFRGSDSEAEDFAELGMGTQLRMNYFLDAPLERYDQRGAINVDRSFGPGDLSGKTMAEMDAAGLTRENLFNRETGTLTAQVGGWQWTRSTLTITWEATAALYFGTNGDWPVNFAQGLGTVPPQYRRAGEAADRAAASAAAWNNRLIVTGHSLGGGLSSAACVRLAARHPDVVVRCDTFNPAGLHANTARAVGGTLAHAESVPVRARYVKDEILNSMQAPTRMVPFLADLLAWGGKSMPEAVSNPSPSPGKSPGPVSLGPVSRNYGAAFANVPVLYTIDRQTLGPRMTVMNRIVAIANAAATVNEFIQNLIDYVLGELSQGNILTYTEAVRMILAFRGDGINEDVIRQVREAMETGGTPPEVDLGDSDYVNNTLEPFINGLLQDTVLLAQILLASGLYHTFPFCAYTFHLRRGS